MKIIRPVAVADSGAYSRAIASDYYDKNGALQSAAPNVPRFSYDPADLSKPPTFLYTNGVDVNTLGMLSPLPETDYPLIDLTKVYVAGDRIMDISTGIHQIYESATGVTSAVTMTIATPCVVSWFNHGLAVGTPIKFTTTGALPTGLAVGTVYYVVPIVGNTGAFNVSTTAGGSALSTSGTQSGVHTAVASNNYNKTPSLYPDIWLPAGSTNKWAMFDQSIESQTTAPDFVAGVVKIPSGYFVDTVVLSNITNGRAARVTMIDPVAGTVFDQTVSLVSDSGIQDLLSYFTEPIVRITDIAISGLPPYSEAFVCASVASTGETVKVGLMKMGLALNVGPTQAGMSLGTINYSVKSTDDFGNTTFIERGFSRTMNLTVWVDKQKTDSLINLLISFRATPAIYIGSDGINSSIIYGVYKDYTAGIDYPTTSTLHIELESMK